MPFAAADPIDSQAEAGKYIGLIERIPLRRAIEGDVSLTQVSGQKGARARILIVEDDWFIASATADALVESGYLIVGPAASLAEAVTMAEKEQIDAAFVDLSLSGTLSIQVADILLSRQIPFYFLSGYPDMPDRYAAVPIIRKPYRMSDLPRAVESMLGMMAASEGVSPTA